MTPALKLMLQESHEPALVWEVIKDMREKYIVAMSEVGVGLVGTIAAVDRLVQARVQEDYQPDGPPLFPPDGGWDRVPG